MKSEVKLIITKVAIWVVMFITIVLGISVGLWKTGALKEAVEKYRKEHATTKAVVNNVSIVTKDNIVPTAVITSPPNSVNIMENALVADFTVVNKSNGRYQYGVIIENRSGKTLETWTVESEIPQDCEIFDSWNCNVRIEDNKIIVTPVEYNAKLESGGRITNIGIILKSSVEMTNFQYKEKLQ